LYILHNMQQQFSYSFADINRVGIFIKQKQFFHKLSLPAITLDTLKT
jgi:hypothetical protein